MKWVVMALSVYQFHATSHHDLSAALSSIEITNQGIFFDETETESSRRTSVASGRNLNTVY